MITRYFANIPDIAYKTFREMMDDVSSLYPDNEVLLVRTGENKYKSWNYQQFYDEIKRVGSWFLHNGFKKGDHVGILCENRPEWCVAYLAVTIAGLIIVPFDVLTAEKSLEVLGRFSDIKGLFISNAQKSKLPGLRKGADKLKVVIALDMPGEKDTVPYGNVSSFDKPSDGLLPPLDGGDTASIIFTSGTTGTPKGVMLSHAGIIQNINASMQSLPIDSSDNFVAVLPFHHTYPTTCSFLSPVSIGGRITIVDKIVGPVIIANIRETTGTHIIGVPLLFDKIRKGMVAKFRDLKGFKGFMVRSLMKFSAFTSKKMKWKTGRVLLKSVRKQAGLGTIRRLVAGGGPLSPVTAEFFDSLGFNIIQGYGMSENGPLIAVSTDKHNNFNAVGLTVKYTTIEIRDKNEEGIGEIVVKSPSLMKGYYNNPEATADVFTEDGFLKTGDLGCFDKKGFLYITGRIKNLIVSPGGKNIYPEEIEALFNDSEFIGDILITGKKVSDKDQGEEVMAVCRPDFEYLESLYPPETLTDEFLIKHLEEEVRETNRKLETYKKIRHVVLRREEFEKTSSQKIKRFLYQNYKG